jgi:hypothetical protein
MSSVGPPGRLPSAAAPIASTAPAAVTNLPPGLANLTAGSIINGVVLGRDSRGHTLVRTANGTLSLATSLALTTGSALSLQVQIVGAQMQMVVLSVDQQPVAQGSDKVEGTAQAAVEGVAGRAAKAAVEGVAGRAAKAAVEGVAGRAAKAAVEGVAGRDAAVRQDAPPPATVTSGTVLTATVTKAPPPAAAPAAHAPASGTSGRPATAPSAAGARDGAPALATTEAVPATPAKLGSRFNLRIVAVAADASVEPAAVLRTAAAGRPGAQLIAGTVTNPSPAGELQLQTPLGLLTLNTKAPLPRSAHVVVEVLGAIESPDGPESPIPAARPSPLLALGRDWPALKEAIATLVRVEANLAANLVDNVLPKPGSGLGANILFLLSALRAGDIRSWLGEPAMRALEHAGRSDLVSRLGEDFAQMSRLALEPAAGEWRTWLVPVHDGSALQLLRMFVKRPPRRNRTDAERESGTRFLIDVELSRLGALQLDGLVKQKRFDLIMRSHAALPADMRRDISAIFEDGLAATGFSGGIAFQATPTFPALPVKEPEARAVGLSV